MESRETKVGTSGAIPAAPSPPPRETTPPLAWRYGRDLARLHLVDPEHVFLFWEVTDRTASRAAGRAGKLAARLLRIDGGSPRVAHTAEGVFAVMNWYFGAEARAVYRGEVGWLLPGGAFETWIVSNDIATPRLEPNLTGEVVLRAGKKGATTRAARGVSEGISPSTRPHEAASAAGARRREAAREVARAPWSGRVLAWSGTARPARSEKGS